jgi:predicted nucleotidyltransferase
MSLARIEEMSGRIEGLRERVPGLELVVLFGSTVRSRRRAGSDVDVGVRCAGPADLDALNGVLAPALGTDRLDLVDLRRVSPLLAMEVARSGRLLYESRPGTFCEFQSLASRRYCDTDKLRRAQRRAIHVFLARHGLSV